MTSKRKLDEIIVLQPKKMKTDSEIFDFKENIYYNDDHFEMVFEPATCIMRRYNPLKDGFKKTEKMQYQIIDNNIIFNEYTIKPKTEKIIKIASYDRHDKSIIIGYEPGLTSDGTTMETLIEAWTKIDNDWVLKRRYHIFCFRNTKKQEIKNIVCTRYHYYVELQHNGFGVIYSVDKDWNYCFGELLWGSNISNLGDYGLWQKNRLQDLKEVGVLKHLSEDLLGVILGYVA